MLREQIKAACEAAKAGGTSCRLDTLRLICAAVRDRDVAAREQGQESGIGDEEIRLLLEQMVLDRRATAAQFESGGQLDLAQRELDEIEVIAAYLPKPLDERELQATCQQVVDELGARTVKDMGRTMEALKRRLGTRMNFQRASAIVRDKLMHSA